MKILIHPRDAWTAGKAHFTGKFSNLAADDVLQRIGHLQIRIWIEGVEAIEQGQGLVHRLLGAHDESSCKMWSNLAGGYV